MENTDRIKDSLKELLMHSELKKNGGVAEREDNLIPSRIDIQYALMRFMIRCLAGELDPKQPLSLYINGSKEDLWEESLIKEQNHKFDNLDEHIPVNINIEDIYATYTAISDLNKQFNNDRALGPEL